MKEENYLEGIYGCLERIEKKVEILSSAPVDKNNAVTRAMRPELPCYGKSGTGLNGI